MDTDFSQGLTDFKTPHIYCICCPGLAGSSPVGRLSSPVPPKSVGWGIGLCRPVQFFHPKLVKTLSLKVGNTLLSKISLSDWCRADRPERDTWYCTNIVILNFFPCDNSVVKYLIDLLFKYYIRTNQWHGQLSDPILKKNNILFYQIVDKTHYFKNVLPWLWCCVQSAK